MIHKFPLTIYRIPGNILQCIIFMVFAVTMTTVKFYHVKIYEASTYHTESSVAPVV